MTSRLTDFRTSSSVDVQGSTTTCCRLLTTLDYLSSDVFGESDGTLIALIWLCFMGCPDLRSLKNPEYFSLFFPEMS